LTPDNRIITYLGRKTVIFDPLNDTMEVWKGATSLDQAILVTPDNRHAIGLSMTNYRCTLWRWPERKEIGQCSETLYGIFGKKRTQYSPVLALSLDGKSFAVSVDNNVRVYRIEPFKLELEASTTGPVAALALSDNGWLAASDKRGFLRVWNIATASLVAQYGFLDGTEHPMYNPTLAFHPGDNSLFVTKGHSDVTVFEIPK
jgi:WD40 repeat protein